MRRAMKKLKGSLICGQWLGNYEGDVPGFLMMNIDDRGSHYEGTAFVTPNPAPNAMALTTCALIRTIDKSPRFTLTNYPLLAVNPTNAHFQDVDQLLGELQRAGVKNTAEFKLPKSATIKFELKDDELAVSWVSDQGMRGIASLARSRADQPTDYLPEKLNWQQFKKRCSDFKHHDVIFRGQSKLARLRTSFHRMGRTDLSRFIVQDIATLHKRLSARTRHVFKLEIPDENGAFFNLVQHHGYPTPLLDWTHSPYVAAFFAYRNISSADARGASRNEKVRIYAFDKKKWHQDFSQIFFTNSQFPHFTIAEFLAIDNERMIPQQAVSSVTNIDDIESYIREMEAKMNGKSYLKVIDLPVKERDLVINELSVMGITAGSLFPGLDGTCEELRERFFIK